MMNSKELQNAKHAICLGFVLSLTWLLFGCGCPPNVKLGEIRLMKPQFLGLSGAESMTYTNAATGETLLFEGEPMQYDTEQLIVASLCTKPPISSQFSYYEVVPFVSKRYKTGGTQYEEIYLYYKVFTPVQGDTTSSIDLLSISGRQISMNIMVSNRGKATVGSLPLISGTNQTRVVADTVINNQRYQQVYCQATKPTVCFTATRGVISYYRNEAWWFQTGFR